jgi:PAS domain S-box-containing protein
MAHDITKHKQTEEELKASEGLYKALVETTGTGYVILDTEGRVLDANPEYVRLTGHRTLKEIIGKNVIEWTAGYEKEKNAEAVNKCARDGHIRNLEIDYMDSAGKITPVEINATVVQIQGTAKILTLCRDITERKRVEEVFRESQIRYRNLYESSPDAIMILEPPSWSFTSGNPATVQMFMARDEAEFISKEPWALSPERQPDGRGSGEKAKEMIETAMRDGSHFFEWTHRRLNGEDFPATVLLSKVELAGKVFLQATVRDITEQKRADLQAQNG